MLELVKKGYISIMQHIIFGDIHIVKRKDYIESDLNEENKINV